MYHILHINTQTGFQEVQNWLYRYFAVKNAENNCLPTPGADNLKNAKKTQNY